jgi:hypothetical protein
MGLGTFFFCINTKQALMPSFEDQCFKYYFIKALLQDDLAKCLIQDRFPVSFSWDQLDLQNIFEELSELNQWFFLFSNTPKLHKNQYSIIERQILPHYSKAFKAIVVKTLQVFLNLSPKISLNPSTSPFSSSLPNPWQNFSLKKLIEKVSALNLINNQINSPNFSDFPQISYKSVLKPKQLFSSLASHVSLNDIYLFLNYYWAYSILINSFVQSTLQEKIQIIELLEQSIQILRHISISYLQTCNLETIIPS